MNISESLARSSFLTRPAVVVTLFCAAAVVAWLVNGGHLLASLFWAGLGTSVVVASVVTFKGFKVQSVVAGLFGYATLLVIALRSVELFWPGSFSPGVAVALLALCGIPVLMGLPLEAIFTAPDRRDRALLVLDFSFMAAAWLMAIWRGLLGGGSFQSVDHGLWVHLAVFYCYFLAMSGLTITVWVKPNPMAFFVSSALVCMSCAEIVRASALTPMTYQHEDVFARVFMTLTWVCILGTIVAQARGYRYHRRDALNDRTQASIATASAVVALGTLFASLAVNSALEPTMLIIACVMVTIFMLREFVRSKYNHQMLQESSTLAYSDQLTGLGNRTLLTQRLEQLSGTVGGVGVVILDIDRFKLINEQAGHDVGDQLLCGVGEQLVVVEATHGGEAFRTGGDEFALLLFGEFDDVLRSAEDARVAVSQVVQSLYPHMGLSASGGVAWLDAADDDVELTRVMTRAAEALRLAKEELDVLRHYTDDIARRVHRQGMIERKLREALEQESLSFAFQPIVSIADGRMAGFETLARWQDSELGFVSPMEFVPIAERTGLVHQLGMAAATDALRLIQKLDAVGIEVFGTCNVSPLQLRSRYFVESICSLVDHFEVAPGRLKIEVTENIFMDQDDPAVLAVQELSELGFPIALDDFGAGYSSLGYVGRIPCDVIKLDRSVTTNLGDETIRSIVQALVQASAQGQVSVVPEGVETQENAQELLAMGVQFAQGWLWSKAVGADELVELFQECGFVPWRGLEVTVQEGNGVE